MSGIGKGTPGPGRPKGVPNKVTASVKAAFLEAFERRGGADALLRWAGSSPAAEAAFYGLASKLIPTETQLSGAEGKPLGVVILPAAVGIGASDAGQDDREVSDNTGGDR